MSGQHAHDGHGHHHGHGHDHGGHGGHGGHAHSLPPDPGKALAIGIAINLVFVAVEWGFGLWSHSLSLLADATHNLGDCLGLVLAWVAARLSRREPTERFTYGWGASSILAALANGLLLMLVTGGLLWEAVHRWQNPQPIESTAVIWVAAAGIFVNGITAWLLHAGHKHDLNMKGAYLHMLGDAGVSLAVAVSGAAILATGWLWLDPAMTIAVGLVIVWSSIGLLRDSTRMALHAVPADVDSAQVRGYLESLPGVASVHDLHIWAMSTTGTALTAHLVVPGTAPGDGFLEMAAKEIGERFRIAHVTLQVEAGNCGKGC
ncbi:cation diffusion facilitator family transporter [Ramlibacter sp. PS4R-6]|uniref:cation diffusion facilitator family transporter n=1 Tax=Ramlibacter sp. PS4R-6 TaxID=3133438 RepID=UPI0030A0CDC5